MDRGGPRTAAHHAAQARRSGKARLRELSDTYGGGSRTARQDASAARSDGGPVPAGPPSDKAERRGMTMMAAGDAGRGERERGKTRRGGTTRDVESASLASIGAASGPEPFQTSRFAQDSRRRQTSWLPSRARTRKSAVSKGEDRCPERSQAFTQQSSLALRGIGPGLCLGSRRLRSFRLPRLDKSLRSVSPA